MRYMYLICSPLPTFIVFALLGWSHVSASVAALVAGISLVAGLFAGRHFVQMLKRTLNGDARHWSGKPASGDFQLMIGAGILVGIVLASLLHMSELGRIIMYYASVAFGASTTAAWAVLTLGTYRIERHAGKNVLLGPDGLYFSEEQA